MLIIEVVNGALRTFFHVTPHTRTPSILRQGLMTGKRRQWNNAFGAKLGNTKLIYLFSDLDPAIQLASRLEWGLKSNKAKDTRVDILELETNALVQPDPSPEANFESRWRGTWWTTDQPIPPTAIKRVLPLTLDMKHDFISRRDQTAM